MASARTMFDLGVSGVQKAVVNNKVVMSGLGIIFVSAIVSMIANAYVASQIDKSACGASDDFAKNAYKFSWVAALIEGLISLGCLGGVGILLWHSMKKSQ